MIIVRALPYLAQFVYFDFPRRDLPLTHRIEIVGSVQAFALSQLIAHRPGDMPPQYNVVAWFRDDTPARLTVDDFFDVAVVGQYVDFDAKPHVVQ